MNLQVRVEKTIRIMLKSICTHKTNDPTAVIKVHLVTSGWMRRNIRIASKYASWFVMCLSTIHRHSKKITSEIQFIVLPRKTWSPFAVGKTTDFGIHPLTGSDGGRQEDEAQQWKTGRTTDLSLEWKRDSIHPTNFIHSSTRLHQLL